MKTVKKKKAPEMERNYGMPNLVCMQYRMVEGGIVYFKGDKIIADTILYKRLVFLLAKEHLYPVGGWQALPEPLFTDVMLKRD